MVSKKAETSHRQKLMTIPTDPTQALNRLNCAFTLKQ